MLEHSCMSAQFCHLQILAADFGAKDWNSDEEDGFDPYWGVVDEGEFSEAYIRKHAGLLLRQLTPLLGRHAPKCGFLEKLAGIAQMPLADLVRPGQDLITWLCSQRAKPNAALLCRLCIMNSSRYWSKGTFL